MANSMQLTLQLQKCSGMKQVSCGSLRPLLTGGGSWQTGSRSVLREAKDSNHHRFTFPTIGYFAPTPAE